MFWSRDTSPRIARNLSGEHAIHVALKVISRATALLRLLKLTASGEMLFSFQRSIFLS